jgi:putative molybdopterin biosynthesis protein
VAFPIGKGSGAVTSFSQADGFVAIDALSTGLDAGLTTEVTLIGGRAKAPDIVIMGSHCVALDVVIQRVAEQAFAARTVAIGSMGGVAAAERGECDIAPVHLLDAVSGTYNSHLIRPGISLHPGWQRMQGFICRTGDARFSGKPRRMRCAPRLRIRPASWSIAMLAPAPVSSSTSCSKAAARRGTPTTAGGQDRA